MNYLKGWNVLWLGLCLEALPFISYAGPGSVQNRLKYEAYSDGSYELDTDNAWFTCLSTHDPTTESILSPIADDYSNVTCHEINVNQIPYARVSSAVVQYQDEDFVTIQHHFMSKPAESKSVSCILASTLVGKQCWRFFSDDEHTQQKVKNIQAFLETSLVRQKAIEVFDPKDQRGITALYSLLLIKYTQ